MGIGQYKPAASILRKAARSSNFLLASIALHLSDVVRVPEWVEEFVVDSFGGIGMRQSQ